MFFSIATKKAESLLIKCICSTFNLPIPHDYQAGLLDKLLMTPRYITDRRLKKDVYSRLAIVLIRSDKNKFDELLQGFIPLLDIHFINYQLLTVVA